MKKEKKLKDEGRKPNPYRREIIIPVRVNADEMRAILGKAGAYTKGNVSGFARAAVLNFVPKKGDFEK